VRVTADPLRGGLHVGEAGWSRHRPLLWRSAQPDHAS
jgi:hypothetical protein